jgi:hypothetical protein
LTTTRTVSCGVLDKAKTTRLILDRASVFDIVQSQEFISHHIDVQYTFFILIYVLIYVFAYRFPEFPDLHLAPRCTKLHHAAVAAFWLRQWELALEVFGSLARPDVISYSAVISCCEKAGILIMTVDGSQWPPTNS